MLNPELARRFDHHPPKDRETVHKHECTREAARGFATQINAAVPEGREKSLALTKIEEAMMWANAGIARRGAND